MQTVDVSKSLTRSALREQNRTKRTTITPPPKSPRNPQGHAFGRASASTARHRPHAPILSLHFFASRGRISPNSSITDSNRRGTAPTSGPSQPATRSTRVTTTRRVASRLSQNSLQRFTSTGVSERDTNGHGFVFGRPPRAVLAEAPCDATAVTREGGRGGGLPKLTAATNPPTRPVREARG